MILRLQVYSLLFSLIYGIIFYFLVLLNKKYLYGNKLSFIIDILFILDNVLLYFIILRYINNGIFHIYFLLMIVLGYIISYFIDKKITKWYNHNRDDYIQDLKIAFNIMFNEYRDPYILRAASVLLREKNIEHLMIIKEN